jgi:plasmid stability protein
MYVEIIALMTLMPVTLTIKQVPDRLAEKLRLRAAATHRSLQGELMEILEDALLRGAPLAREPVPSYTAKAPTQAPAKEAPAHGPRMTLAELWERARRLGPPSKSESARIVRRLRDERHHS